jgi:hypothetical protein
MATIVKPWVKSMQRWSWIITVLWMVIANIWKLFGFVCMLSPISIALLGRGKMHCARVCPRGSFIGTFTGKISRRRPKPRFMNTRTFRWILWGLMMGTFLTLIIHAIPYGIAVLGSTVLVFMEAATALAFISGILFTPRAWCTYCPSPQATYDHSLRKRDQASDVARLKVPDTLVSEVQTRRASRCQTRGCQRC